MMMMKAFSEFVVLLSLLLAFANVVTARPSLSESVMPAPAAPPAANDASSEAVESAAVPADDDDDDNVSNSGADDSEPESESEEAEEPEAAPSSGHGQCCPSGWKEFDSHCYKGFTLQPLPFFSVAKACQKYDAHFVDIHSKAEYQFVKSEWDLNKYWIGVISYSDGHHQNQDGSATEFQGFDDPVWDAKEPHPYICEMSQCVGEAPSDSEEE